MGKDRIRSAVQRRQEERIIKRALEILESRLKKTPETTFIDITETKQYLRLKISTLEHEVFVVIFLDNKHRLIAYKEMFFGTVDACSVYPREVVKEALRLNASAVIFAHNHPSGVAEPSQNDQRITEKLRIGLELVDVRVLDHFIIGGYHVVSFVERGLL